MAHKYARPPSYREMWPTYAKLWDACEIAPGRSRATAIGLSIAIASSSDGMKFVACVNGGQIYTSP